MQVLQHELMAVPPVAERGDVERLCEGYEHLNRTGEVPHDLFDPAVEYDQPDVIIGTETYVGHEGIERALSDMRSSFEGLELHPTDLIYEGGSEVVVRVSARGRGKGSGAEVDGRFYHVWWLRDGRIVRGRAFLSRCEALDAAIGESRLPVAA